MVVCLLGFLFFVLFCFFFFFLDFTTGLYWWRKEGMLEGRKEICVVFEVVEFAVKNCRRW